MNVLFPNISLPSTIWLPAVNVGYTDENGHTYNYAILTSGDYTVADCSNVYIGSNAVVRLKVTGSVNQSGNNVLRIASGGSLKLYMMGTSFKLAGNGAVNGSGLANDNGNAASFYYFGLASNTSIDFHGNASFTGAVYAPNADFQLGGGGNNTYDFVGASVTKSVKMNGKFNFHYDENLRRNNMGRGYIPTSWKES